MRALAKGDAIGVRNPAATRPWQHVLEPLGGYLRLAERLSEDPSLASAYNFGPQLEANRSVRELVEQVLRHWPGRWEDQRDPQAPHEANLLHLVIDKAHHELDWAPRWDFATTVERTVNWYRRLLVSGSSSEECCQADLAAYWSAAP
jgi:CDP-glucose 4,6-dehydratase